MSAKSSGLNAKGPSLSLEQKNFCVVLTYSIKWASEIRKFHPVVQQWLRNVQKSVMHMQLFFCPSKPINIVVIQKFCCHGNVTSRFSSLSVFPMKIPGQYLTLCLLIGRIWGLWHDPLWENRETSWFTESCVFQASKEETEAGEGRESRDTLEGTPASRFSLLALKKAKK